MRNQKYWLVLVIAIIILILAYFSVFYFEKYVTGSAIISPPFYINAWSIKTSEVIIELKNNEKEDYTIQSISVDRCGEYSTPTSIEQETKLTTIITCRPELTVGELFESEVTIIYRKFDSKIDLTSKGAITGKVRY